MSDSETKAPKKRLNPKQIAKQREKAAELMPKSLKTVQKQLSTFLESTRSQTVLNYHNLGKIVQEVQANPGEFVGSDGTPGMTLLKRYFGAESSTIGKAARFAREYTDAELKTFLARRNEQTGFTLTWKHAIYLLAVESKTARAVFEEQAVKKMLDPSALCKLIQSKLGRKGSGGRPHKVEKDAWGKLAQMLKVAKDFVTRYETVWDGTDNSVFTELQTLQEDETIEITHVEAAREVATLFTQIAALTNMGATRALAVSENLQLIAERNEANNVANAVASSEALRPLEV